MIFYRKKYWDGINHWFWVVKFPKQNNAKQQKFQHNADKTVSARLTEESKDS
jgi:hypothetical protein